MSFLRYITLSDASSTLNKKNSQLHNGKSLCEAGNESAGSRIGTCGPPLVRHQKSNSRRLLNQLARLRCLSEPAYRVKRPEKVAEVESLIEQLERLTHELDEDEHLLDRAERRDWPFEYHEDSNESEDSGDDRIKRVNWLDDEQTLVPRIEDGIDFGERDDIHPIEMETIERSHTNLSGRISDSPSPEVMSKNWFDVPISQFRRRYSAATRPNSRPDSGLSTDSNLPTLGQVAESPSVEKYKTALLETPTRRRPRIALQNPRAKSPLVLVSSGQLRERQHDDSVSKGSKGQDEIVRVECYEDTLRRRQRKERAQQQATCELACHYDFSDEDISGDSLSQTRPKYRYSTDQNDTMNRRSSTGSPTSSLTSQNESWERLDYRGVEIKSQSRAAGGCRDSPNVSAKVTGDNFSENMRPPRNNSTPFTLGEYKSRI